MVLMSKGFKLRDSAKHAQLLAEIEVARVCDRLHKLPSEVMAEDAYTIRRVMALLDEIDRIRMARSNPKQGRSNGG